MVHVGGGVPKGKVISSNERWLSLGRASQILGVNEATLRRWADEGKVKVFVTPGGHRRFAAGELRRLLEREGKAKGGVPLLSWVRSRFQRQQLSRREALRARPWYGAFDEGARLRAMERGWQAVATIEACLTGAKSWEGAAAELRSQGEEVGREAARLGLSSTDAVEAFLFYRRQFLEAIRQAGRSHLTREGQLAEAMQKSSNLLDEMLLTMEITYQQAKVTLDQGPPEADQGG